MDDAPGGEERERLSWTEFGHASRVLARQVADDGYEPDLILSVARGGLLVGAALGYALDVKNAWTMNVEFYTGVDERLDVPMILPPVPDLVDLETARVLIADDVADTGETLRLVQRLLRRKGRRGSLRGALREAALDGEQRVRVETDRALDRLPLERRGARGEATTARPGVAPERGSRRGSSRGRRGTSPTGRCRGRVPLSAASRTRAPRRSPGRRAPLRRARPARRSDAAAWPASLISEYAFPSSIPAAKNSNRSASDGSSSIVRAKGESSIGCP